MKLDKLHNGPIKIHNRIIDILNDQSFYKSLVYIRLYKENIYQLQLVHNKYTYIWKGYRGHNYTLQDTQKPCNQKETQPSSSMPLFAIIGLHRQGNR